MSVLSVYIIILIDSVPFIIIIVSMGNPRYSPSLENPVHPVHDTRFLGFSEARGVTLGENVFPRFWRERRSVTKQVARSFAIKFLNSTRKLPEVRSLIDFASARRVYDSCAQQHARRSFSELKLLNTLFVLG